MPAFTSADVESVGTAVDEAASQLITLSHEIAADPELAYQEHRAVVRCSDLLEQYGFTVERGSYGQPTSFAARIGSSGPHVVVCAEYDALPGVGHACGHNIIAASAVGAGIALAPLVEAAGLRVTVLGTHAEEAGGGKVELIDAGAFDDATAAIMMHPSPFDDYAPRSLSCEDWRVVYHGQASHASASPELGRNALDGVVASYTSIAMLRQHFRPLQQVHGVILDGGEAANVIPERAEVSYFLRAVDEADLQDLRQRVRACLEGAALATGTTFEMRVDGHAFEPLTVSEGLASTFTQACEAIGREFAAEPSGNPLSGSTDFGNVSQRVPGLHADMAVYSWPAVNHQHEFAAICVSEAGDRTMLDGAKALALTALAVAADPSIASSPGETSRTCVVHSRDSSSSIDTRTTSPSSLHLRTRFGTASSQPWFLSRQTLVGQVTPSTVADTGTRPNEPAKSGATSRGTATNVQAAGPSQRNNSASNASGMGPS